MPESSIDPDATDRSSGSGESTRRVLRDFLLAGSARCPSCGYDVAGCEDAKCPECGWALALQLRPPASFVPFWVFSLLINGWLFLWGAGGAVTTWLRAWSYHGTANGRVASGTAPGAGATGIRSLGESLRTYFLSQNLLDQVSIVLFLVCCLAGGIGLACTPAMRRVSARTGAWLISLSTALFLATMVNYVVKYVAVLSRAY
ncbi:MAG: hypothetical protein J0L78_11120 [Planctomycetes bacterium]|nr:hypothetical protein [Planctomycetota bacterium]